MKRKITVIGAGSVGSTIAYTLSQQDIANEIVLIDINQKKADGEVMDIKQGTSFRDPISIVSGTYEDAKDSNIVILTSGVARKPGQTRLELTQINVDIIKDITPKIVAAAPNALYIIVSNPVDISEEGTIKNKVKEINKNLETLLRGGKSRVEGNSGCIKIFNAVHNHLGSNKNDYINSVENGNFIVKICIDLIALKA